MLSDKKKQIGNIVQLILSKGDEQKTIVSISGDFGTGKSAMVESVEDELFRGKQTDCMLKISDTGDTRFISDFVCKLADGFRDSSDTGREFNRETALFKSRFDDLLDKFEKKNNLVFGKYFRRNYLKSSAMCKAEEHHAADNSDMLAEHIQRLFNNNDEKLLLLEPEKIFAETIIADLADYYGLLENIYSGDQAKDSLKVIVIVDNYDPVSGSVARWLAGTFLSYIYDKRFGDFIAYEFSDELRNIKVIDLFDFRFILASRDDALYETIRVSKDKFLSKVYSMRLKDFMPSEVLEIFENLGTDYSDRIDKIMDVTSGIPALVNMYADYLTKQSEPDIWNIYNYASEMIIKYLAGYQKEWIKQISFLDSFTEHSLRYLPAIGIEYARAYAFLANSKGLAEKAGAGSKLLPSPKVQKYVTRHLELTSNREAGKYRHNARTCSTVEDIFEGLDFHRVEILRKIAYFKRFDTEFFPENAFGKEAPMIREIIEGKPELFIENKFTKSLKIVDAETLNEFNAVVDKDNYSKNCEYARELWEQYKDLLQSRIEGRRKSMSEIESCREVTMDGLEDISRNLKEKERQLRKSREEYEQLKRTLEQGSLSENTGFLYWFLGIAVIISLPGLFPDIILSNIFSSGATDVLSVVSLSLAGAGLAGTAIVYLHRRSKKLDPASKEIISGRFDKAEDQLRQHFEEYELADKKYRNASIKFEKTENEISALKIQMEDDRQRLNEPFV